MGARSTEQFSREGAVYFLGHSTDIPNPTQDLPGWADWAVRFDGTSALIEIDANEFLKYFESNQINYAERFEGFSHFAESGNPVFNSSILEARAKMSLEKARARYTRGDFGVV